MRALSRLVALTLFWDQRGGTGGVCSTALHGTALLRAVACAYSVLRVASVVTGATIVVDGAPGFHPTSPMICFDTDLLPMSMSRVAVHTCACGCMCYHVAQYVESLALLASVIVCTH